MAPELSGQKLDYAGPPIDVFALGIILFQMLTCKPLQLEPKDIWWQKFTQDPIEALSEREIELDEEITNLIAQMVQEDPAMRPSIAKIKEHAWM